MYGKKVVELGDERLVNSVVVILTGRDGGKNTKI